LKVSSS